MTITSFLRRPLVHVLVLAMVAVAAPAGATEVPQVPPLPTDARDLSTAGTDPAAPADRTSEDARQALADASIGGLTSAWFEPNVGQFRRGVQMLGRSGRSTIELTRRGAVVVVRDRSGGVARVSWKPVGGTPSAPVGAKRRAGVTNYFLGDDPSAWFPDVPRYGSARYRDVWPGVDLVYRPSGASIAYDVHLDESVDPSVVRLRVGGARKIRVDETSGALVIETAAGTLRQSAPVAFQPSGGTRRRVDARFVVKGREVSFSVEGRNPALPLVIDPTFVPEYWSFLGGAKDDFGTDVALFTSPTGATKVAVLGNTDSVDMPATGGAYASTLDTTSSNPNEHEDLFVAEFDLSRPPASQLLWLTYLGGRAEEESSAVAYGPDGRVYVAGVGRSGFPTTADAFQPSAPSTGQNGILAVLDPSASGPAQLVYSTFLAAPSSVGTIIGGHASLRGASGLTVAADGRAYVTGYTQDALKFPTTTGAFMEAGTLKGTQAYLAIVDPQLDGVASLAYSTLLGGTNGSANGMSIAFDADGLVHLSGWTNSMNFPVTSDAYQPTVGMRTDSPSGSWDAFVVVLNLEAVGAAQLVYGTYFGRDRDESAWGLGVTADGLIYLTGRGSSDDLHLPGGFAGPSDNTDAYFIVLDRRLTGAQQLRYGTYLRSYHSGPQIELVGDLAYIASGAGLLPDASGAVGENNLILVDPTLTGDASLLGVGGSGSGAWARGLAVDGAGVAYATGYVGRQNSATDDAFDGSQNGLTDAFLTRIVPQDELAPIWPSDATLDVAGRGSDFGIVRWPYAADDLSVASYRVSVGGEPAATVAAHTHGIALTGLAALTTYTVSVVATDAAGNVSAPLQANFTTDAPALPAQAALGAAALEGGRVELAWDPDDDADVVAYRVYRRIGGAAEAQVHEVAVPSTRTLDTGLPASTEIAYRVTAVLADGSERAHTVSTTTTTPDLHVESVRWDADLRNGVLVRGRNLTIDAHAEALRTMVARVEVLSWFANGDPAGTVLAEPAPATLEVALKERQPGDYRGALLLDGIAEVRSVRALVRDGHGHEAAASTEEGLPLSVSGSLDISVDLGLEAWQVESARLFVRSDETGDGDVLLLSGATSELSTRELTPGTYDAVVRDRVNRLLAEVPLIVRPGRRDAVAPSFGEVRPHLPFTLRVEGLNGAVLPGVDVTVSDAATGEEYLRARTGTDGRVGGTARSAALSVRLDPGELPYAKETLAATLTAYDQTVPLALSASLPTAQLTGTVRGPDGATRSGVRVSVSTSVDDRVFAVSTTTGTDGTYSVVAFRGAATIEAYERWYGQKLDIERTVSGDAVVDITLDAPVVGTLHLELSTRFAADTTARPVDLDPRAAFHFHTWARSGRFNARAMETTQVIVDRIDAPIEVCADGAESDLPKACTSVTLDPVTRVASASLALVQTAVVVGELSFADGSAPSRWSARVHAVQDGARTFVRSETGAGSDLDVSLFAPGSFEIVLHATKVVGERSVSHTATIPVVASEGDVVDVGDVVLWPVGAAFTLTPRTVVPGERAQVIFEIPEMPAGGCAREGTIAFVLPEGVSFVEGSATENGTPVSDPSGWEWTFFGGGPIYAPARTIGFWVRISPETDAQALWIRRSTTTTQHCPSGGEATLGGTDGGTDPVSEPVVTHSDNVLVIAGTRLFAPRYATTSEVALSGRAPADSAVRVFVDGSLAGTTTATAGGFWRKTVELPSTPLPRPFVLTAESEIGGRVAATPDSIVEYDPTRPTLRTMALQQEDGRRIEVDPRGGIARFPYVFAPGKSFEVELAFTHPERVAGARVRIGTSSTKASRRTDGTWTAVLEPSFVQLGKVRATWDVKPAALSLTADRGFTVEEIRAAQRPPFNTIENYEIVEPSAAGEPTVVTADLPAFADATLRAEIRGVRSSYEPTAEELARAERTGIHLYNLKWSVEALDGELRMKASAHVPDSALDDPGTSEGLFALALDTDVIASSSDSGGSGTDVLLDIATFSVNFLPDALSPLAALLGPILDAVGAYQLIQELNRTLEFVQEWCSPEAAQKYADQLEGIYEQILGGLLLLGPVMAITGGILLGTTGPLGLAIALGTFSFLFGKLISELMEEGLKGVQDDIFEDPACQPPDPFDPSKDDEDDDDGSCSDCVMDPVYIFDPSGYVYELFPEDRLSGVTTVLEHAPDPDGPWTSWDAEWFGQENPLTTDAQGRYGWDVPEGWWRVRYEKQGYETAYSDVLRVLPPHFDVNVPMSSLSPPKIVHVSARAADPFIDVTFDRWVKTSTLSETTARVLTNEGDPVPTEVSGVDPRTTASGDEVTKTARLRVPAALGTGDRYKVALDRALSTYAGIPLGDDVVRSVKVTAAPVVEAPAKMKTQYGDPVGNVRISATDADSSTLTASTTWSAAGMPAEAGLPEGLSLSSASCARVPAGLSCSWTISGRPLLPAGVYSIRVAVSDDVAPVVRTIELTVDSEDVVVADANGLPLLVAIADGPEGARRVTLRLSEPETNLLTGQQGAGDLTKASVTAVATDASATRAIAGTCVPTSGDEDVAGSSITCAFAGLAVGAHTLTVVVDGGFYAGAATASLVVQDLVPRQGT